MNPELQHFTEEIESTFSPETEFENQRFDPEVYLDQMRILLRTGEVKTGGSTRAEYYAVANTVSAEATSWIESFRLPAENTEDELYDRLCKGFVKEVESLAIVSCRAIEKGFEVQRLNTFSQDEKQDIFSQLLSDHLMIAASLRGKEGKLTNKIFERSPVLFHRPEYIQYLSQKYDHLTASLLQSRISLAPQNPEAALEQYCQREGIPINEDRTDKRSEVDAEEYIQTFRSLLISNQVKTSNRPSEDIIKTSKGIARKANNWAKKELTNPEFGGLTDKQRDVLKRSFSKKATVLERVSDRAWRQGMLPLPLDQLSRSELQNVFGIVLRDQYKICQILDGDAGMPTEKMLENNIVLYHDPDHVSEVLEKYRHISRAYLHSLTCYYPKNFETALERLQEKIVTLHDKCPEVSEQALQWLISKNFVNAEQVVEQYQDRHLPVTILNPKELKKFVPNDAEFSKTLTLCDQVVDFLWTKSNEREIADVAVKEFRELYRNVHGRNPNQLLLLKATRVLSEMEMISIWKDSNVGMTFSLTETGYSKVNDSL